MWLINNKEVGTLNIKIIREENNLTQQELAEKMGVSRYTVIDWENGKREIRKNVGVGLI